MLPQGLPKITTDCLMSTVLLMKSLRMHDVFNFDYLDPPAAESLMKALHSLVELELLSPMDTLTKRGREAINFPVAPNMAVALIESRNFGCTQSMLTVAAMTSVQAVFNRSCC